MGQARKETGKSHGGKRRGKGRNAHFMDAAFEGYIRDLALRFWREVDDTFDVNGGDMQNALAETGRFGGPYGEIWNRNWQALLETFRAVPSSTVFEIIEKAVHDALNEEREERRRLDDDTVEDTGGYKEFVGRAMGQLLEEASGEIEDMDGE